MTGHDDLNLRMAETVRQLQHSADVQDTLQAAAEAATILVSGCDAAGITVVSHGRRVTTAAATSAAVRAADELQYALGEGPCLDAVTENEVVESPRLAEDPRWPRWAPAVRRDHGIEAMLSVRLFTDGHTIGALNLYSTTGPYPDGNRAEAYLLAALVAVAIAAARTDASLTSAVDSRTAIGQAQGILMERFDIDAEQAFAFLKRVSQHENVKVRALADQLITTRSLPGTPSPD